MKVGVVVATFVYKAYDQLGNKKAGRIAVPSELDARRELRERGLNTYLLQDSRAFRKALRRQRKRRRIIMISGAVAIAIALVASGVIVGYAGRTPSLEVADYKQAGILKGGSGNFVASTEQGEEFAQKIYEVWQGFAPDVITGIEVRKQFMSIYVDRRVRELDESNLDALADNSVRALQREFGSAAATLLLIEDDVTFMEVRYSPYTRETAVTRY